MDLEEMDLKWQMAMLSVRVHKFEQKARRKIDFDKKESARFNKKNFRCYKCLQRGHFSRECRAKRGNDKQRYSSFKIQEIGKKEEDSKALITVDTLVDWTEHDGQSDGVIAPKEFGMIAGYDIEDAITECAAKIYNLITGADTKEASIAGDAGEFALMGVTSEVHNCPFGCDNKYNELQKQHNELNEQNSEYFIQVQAYKNSLKTLEKQKRVLQKNQLTLEDKIRVLSIELENTTNLLKHSERINAIAETAKKELQTKLDNHLVQIEKWRTSSKNLFRLIDSSMSVRTKVGLGFNNYIRENKLGWDDSAFSVFTTNSEEVEGRPLFNRFAKADSMKAVPPPLSGDYTPLSDHIDLDESQMSYGTKSSTSADSNSVSNDFVSCDNSDKSSEVITNDFVSSDSSVKSSEPKSNDSTSYASTSSVSTGGSRVKQENPYSDAEDEGIFDSGCSRSMTCNMERLDDFQEFQGGKVTFRGGEEPLSTPPRQQTPPASPPSPPRSTQAPPTGHTSGGAEDLITLTVVSSVVSTLVQKVVVSDSDAKRRRLEQDVDWMLYLSLAMQLSHIPTDVPTGVAPADISNKGKTTMVEEDITIKERTLKQMEYDRLVRRQQEVLASAMYYTEADWINIMAQVKANASLSKTLLGDDVTEDNFPVRMAALIKRKKQALAEKLAKERMERPMTPVQQRTYMRQFVKNQSSALYSTGWTKAKVESFTDASIENEAPILWSALAGWEVISTPLGEINALYRSDQSTKHFTTLREILHMVDRHDLLKLYGMVVTIHENLCAGAGLMLWGDLQVLMDSQEGGKGSFVWNNQSHWQIRSWRLYTLSNVHVLETVSGEVLYMFVDVSYPLSVKLMERMLKHKLEIDKDVVGNDMTTFNKATKTANYMVLEGVLMKNKDAASSRDIQLICAEFSSIQVKTQADWMLLQSSYFNPQVQD
ncbi:ribonuclease H-like domain-containing protein [Tanacetum coccineum]